MPVKSEGKKGWIGSLLVHGIIGIILLLWRVDHSITQPEYIEVSWGSLSNVTVPRAVASRSAPPGGTIQSSSPRSRTSVDLPERTLAANEDVLPVPRTRKLLVDESFHPSGVRAADGVSGKKESSASPGEKEQFLVEKGTSGVGKVSAPSGDSPEGSEVGKSVGFSMQWSDGGDRRLVSGDLPAYPEGVNVEAQIKIEAVVLPGGKVKSLKPIQKANTRLEDAAVSEVRHWVFEPLAKSVPQREQTCLITFNFILR